MSRRNQYIGKSGQLHMMGEFLMRGWNVAIPEVDIGDDIFVVQDYEGTLRRVQVKSASSVRRSYGFSAQFQLRHDQLSSLRPVQLHYAFLVRHNNSWSTEVIIPQQELFDYVERGMGTKRNNTLQLYFAYTLDSSSQIDSVRCSNIDLTAYVRNYFYFPDVDHAQQGGKED